jgi:hypothetical protein
MYFGPLLPIQCSKSTRWTLPKRKRRMTSPTFALNR